MSNKDEFDGDACIVLPKNYLNSAEAVAEIYEKELAEAATSFEVDHLKRGPGYLKGALLASLLWTLPSIWSVCI